jgi:hypothetical protein
MVGPDRGLSAQLYDVMVRALSIVAKPLNSFARPSRSSAASLWIKSPRGRGGDRTAGLSLGGLVYRGWNVRPQVAMMNQGQS